MSREKQPVNGITEGVIWKQLLLFFFPIMLGTFFQQLYNTADAIIVGKFVGKEALAAVGGTTGTLISLLVGFFVGLSSGASVIISQFFGARRGEDVSRAVHTTVMLAIVSGAMLTVLGVLTSEKVLLLMGTPPEVMVYAMPYIRIYFLGMIPSLIYNIGSGILRAVGDSRRPLAFLICATMTNVVMDVIFVLGMNGGVAGAAAATVASQLMSAVLVVATLRRSPFAYRLRLRKLRLHGDMLRHIVRIGLPAGMQSVMYSLSNIIIQAGVNGFGTDVMAAWTAYGKMDGLYWMTISAFGVAITTFAGQNFGARQYDRMKKSVNVCLSISAGTTVVLSAVMIFVARPLLALFTDDAGAYNRLRHRVPDRADVHHLYLHRDSLRRAARRGRFLCAHPDDADGRVSAARVLGGGDRAQAPSAQHAAAQLPDHLGHHVGPVPRVLSARQVA